MAATHRYLVASDLDGTLIPPREAAPTEDPTAFARALEGARDIALAYVTGRHLELAVEGIGSAGLPDPDFLVCDVGTSVYRRGAGTYVLDARYAEVMRGAMAGADAADVRARLSSVDDLSPQEEAKQGDFKASFYFPWESGGEVSSKVGAALRASGIQAEVVVSRDPVTSVGLLDVLPAGGAKDRAVRYLAEVLGLPLERVVFSGDSGNDRAALLCGVRAILVGNAPEELSEEVAREAERLGLADRVHLAEGNYAAGVLEGLEAFGVL